MGMERQGSGMENDALAKRQQAAAEPALGHDLEAKKSAPATNAKAQIRINDMVYDVSDFIKKHPGGNIMHYYYGQDATDAYVSFHAGSKKAMEMLMELPKVRVQDVIARGPEELKASGAAPSLTQPPSALTLEFRQLRARWKRDGMMKGRIEMEIGLLSMILAMMAGSLYLLSLGWLVASGLVMGVAWAQCGFLQHNLGHLEVTNKPYWDKLGNCFVEGFLKGGSGSWWRGRHSKHHAKPNINPHDTDLRTTPLFAWDEQLVMKCPRWLARYQHMLFVPLLALYVPVFFVTTKKYMLVKGKKFEILLSALHYVCFIGLLFLCDPRLSWWSVFAWFYTGYAVQGMYLGFFFSLSHFALPVSHDKDEDVDWVTMHCRSTLDWGLDWFGWAWIAGHLNYQIEHHLTPEMPSYNYKLVDREVKALCEKHGVEYIAMSFMDSVRLNLGTLKEVGQKRANNTLGQAKAGTPKEPLLATS